MSANKDFLSWPLDSGIYFFLISGAQLSLSDELKVQMGYLEVAVAQGRELQQE